MVFVSFRYSLYLPRIHFRIHFLGWIEVKLNKKVVSCICQPLKLCCKAFDFKALDIFPVAFMMLATKVIFYFFLVGISVTSARKLSCKTIMNSFYQTEDQYYNLGCDRTNDDSEKVLLYRCRFLQKKMDIVGRQYYDFQVNLRSFEYLQFWF